MSLGSTFLAGDLVFLGKKDAQEKHYGPPIGVPSRGSCFLEKSCPGKAMSLGLAFLAGAFVLRENRSRKNYVSRIAVPSRGLCFPRKKACPGKNDVSRIGVPSRGFCFLRKTCPEKSYVSRVGVPSRGVCFLRKACPEKSYVSRVAVPSRGFCFLKKTCPGKKLCIWGWIHSDRLDAFPLLPISKGRVGSPNKRPAPIWEIRNPTTVVYNSTLILRDPGTLPR